MLSHWETHVYSAWKHVSTLLGNLCSSHVHPTWKPVSLPLGNPCALHLEMCPSHLEPILCPSHMETCVCSPWKHCVIPGKAVFPPLETHVSCTWNPVSIPLENPCSTTGKNCVLHLENSCSSTGKTVFSSRFPEHCKTPVFPLENPCSATGKPVFHRSLLEPHVYPALMSPLLCSAGAWKFPLGFTRSFYQESSPNKSEEEQNDGGNLSSFPQVFLTLPIFQAVAEGGMKGILDF